MSLETATNVEETSTAASSPYDDPDSVHEDDAGPFATGYGSRVLPVYVPDPESEAYYLKLYETHSSRESDHYDTSRGTKLAVIFNHKQFMNGRDPPRSGTEKDCSKIYQVFGQKLGFKCEFHDDLTASQISLEMSRLAERRDLCCLALFILTHGETNGTLHAFDTNFRLDKHIIAQLLPDNCPNLAGKPKLVFIQACQGKDTDPGVLLRPQSVQSGTRSRHASTDGVAMSETYCIPNYADLLIYQASYHGFYSFRSGSRGSWFIQALCLCLENSSENDSLDAVLKRVSRQVAIDKTSNVPNEPILDRKKQIPLKQSTLIREVYLKRNWAEIKEKVSASKPQENSPTKKNKLKTKSDCRIM